MAPQLGRRAFYHPSTPFAMLIRGFCCVFSPHAAVYREAEFLEAYLLRRRLAFQVAHDVVQVYVIHLQLPHVCVKMVERQLDDRGSVYQLFLHDAVDHPGYGLRRTEAYYL